MTEMPDNSGKIAAGVAGIALFAFILWAFNTDFLVGHYETHWGPGWLLAIACFGCVAAFVLTFMAILRKANWKRILLLFGIVILSLPVFFMSLAQLSESDTQLGNYIERFLESL